MLVALLVFLGACGCPDPPPPSDAQVEPENISQDEATKALEMAFRDAANQAPNQAEDAAAAALQKAFDEAIVERKKAAEEQVNAPRTTDAPSDADTPPAAVVKKDGASCAEAEECESGVCEGLGCTANAPGTCAPEKRACTRDRRPYCGCDGETFWTSSSCVGRRYARAGTCEPMEGAQGG